MLSGYGSKSGTIVWRTNVRKAHGCLRSASGYPVEALRSEQGGYGVEFRAAHATPGALSFGGELSSEGRCG